VNAREVVVIGAGIVGAAVARELAVRGVDVLLLDADDVSGGTTGLGEGNVLCADKDAGPELDLCVAGRALFDELGEEARIRRKGALVVHPEAATWEAEPARLERLRSAGVEGHLVPADDVRELEPALTGPVHGASFFPGDLQCDPRAIARMLAREVPDVRTHTRVASVATGGVALESGERIAAGAVVLAAGPWSAALAATAGLRLPVEPRKGQLVRLERRPGFLAHKVIDGSYMTAVASSGAGLLTSSVIETTLDGHVLVGSSRERRGFDLSVDPVVSQALLGRAKLIAPGLGALRVDSAWAGLRPWLPGGLPAIGRSAVADGLWVATGHEGAGVAHGPITGRLIAQGICGEPSELDLTPFDPDRFS
jgi:D-hydroxyproline dehydrogenase subunit beta